jgi:replicative DNA helicase
MTVPPHDLDAERAVIGAMLVSEGAASLVPDIVSRGDFYSETHRIIYDAMTTLAASGTPVDRLTVSDELSRIGEFEKVGGKGYFLSLVESMPTAANATRYARMVKDKALLRDLAETADAIGRSAREPEDAAARVLEDAEEAIYGLSHTGATSGFQGLTVLAPNVLEDIQDLYERGNKVTGLPTGFRDVDSMTGGSHPGDLDILAARPAMGKTAFALDVIRHVAHLGQPVAVFSLEMSKEQLVQRLVSAESGIPLRDIRNGDVKGEWSDLVAAIGTVSKLPIDIDDSAGISVSQMRSRLRRLYARLKSSPGLVVVDYLQLVTPGRLERQANRNEQVAGISRALKILARDFSVPVLCLSQLSRACEQRADKRPMLSDLRDSGAIENDADRVSFLYRDEYYNDDSEKEGIADLIISKHRNGGLGTVELAFQKEFPRFMSYAGDDGY